MRKFCAALLLLSVLFYPKAAMAGPYDDINTNIPLKQYILSYYGFDDTELEINDVFIDLVKQQNRVVDLDLSSATGIKSFQGLEVLDVLGVSELYISNVKAPFETDESGAWAKITSLKKLKRLEAENCGITKLPNFKGMSLNSLNVAGNSISDMSPLSTIADLKELGIGGKRLDSFAFLTNMNSLESLTIKEAGFGDGNWQSISGMSGLHTLVLDGNDITSPQPLADMKKAGNFPKLTLLSLERNLIGEWAASMPNNLEGIQLTSGSRQQYKPAVLLGGVSVDSVDISSDTDIRIVKRVPNTGHYVEITPIEANLSATCAVLSQKGSGITVSPRINGSGVLSVKLFGGAANESNVTLQVPLNVKGGNLKAGMKLTAGGKSVFHEYDGLFAGAEVQLQVPPRNECKRMFQLVGVDLDDYDMPQGSAAGVRAGQQSEVVFPRISNGKVIIRHCMENGVEMAAETINSVQAGSHTYQPRIDLPGYEPVSGPRTVRISFDRRSSEIVFRYKYTGREAGQGVNNHGEVQNGVYKPSVPFEIMLAL